MYYKGIRQCPHGNVSGTTYRLSSYEFRAIFDSDIVYISCNLDHIYDWRRVNHFDFFVQIPHIIIERYRSRLFFSHFNFLVSFVSSILPAYIFALSPMNSVNTKLFLSFIKPGIFARSIPYTLIRWTIIRVESSDIAFHSLVSIVAFYMVNETCRVGVHDLTFGDTLVICTSDEIRTNKFSIYRVCTRYVNMKPEFTSYYRCNSVTR